jgi:hypothetical protein
MASALRVEGARSDLSSLGIGAISTIKLLAIATADDNGWWCYPAASASTEVDPVFSGPAAWLEWAPFRRDRRSGR